MQECIGPIVLHTTIDDAHDTRLRAPRIAIEAITPQVDAGRFPARRTAGENIKIAADIFCDGHDRLAAVVRWRAADVNDWTQTPLTLIGNDRWSADIHLERTGLHYFTIEAWVEVFASLCAQMTKKHAAHQSIAVEILEGCELVALYATHSDQTGLAELAQRLEAADPDTQRDLLLDPETERLMQHADPRAFRTRHSPELCIDAERIGARFANWYELFPRSQSTTPGQHGNFDDVIAKLPMIRAMGFDVLYMTPIHPIGRTNRKGRNNTLVAGPNDPGSPYAIGAAEGGHDAVHPELGTLDDFRRLCAHAAEQGIEVALDFAIQCAPDHPWLREHPEWFKWRPDGSIQYAENPPKKYEDIVNVAFYAEGALPSLWIALRDIVQFWVNQGVRIFRVDNPHTKPLPFWEWMIADIRARDPGVIFLSEAFTRPKMMYRLAKIGFSQSYTYFTWRNTARDMRDYLEELTQSAARDFFRPHFFVNTPDINPIFLHESGRPGFLLRAALATTLSGLWGIYNGFELCEAQSLDGREEYLDSEKYQLRHWDLEKAGNIVAEITQLNAIRKENTALQSHLGVTFLDTTNPKLLCYIKASPDDSNVVLVAVSLDPHEAQDATITLTPDLLRTPLPTPFTMRALMNNESETWEMGERSITIDPASLPFAIWRFERSETA
jgi:starch synthase (maltosyl-transferring)